MTAVYEHTDGVGLVGHGALQAAKALIPLTHSILLRVKGVLVLLS